MPKDTFLNLPEEKRQLIENVAIDEFAEYGFEKASINRIVKAASIAKGSFYQYFEDKADLFLHIIAIVGEKKLEYVSPVMMNPSDYDFFTLLEELYRSGLAFARNHPTESKISFEVFKNQNNPVFNAVIVESRRSGLAFYESLLEIGIERGEIDPEIDRSFISQMLMQLQISMLDYFLEANDGESGMDDILPTVQMMISLIKNGIQCQKLGERSQ